MNPNDPVESLIISFLQRFTTRRTSEICYYVKRNIKDKYRSSKQIVRRIAYLRDVGVLVSKGRIMAEDKWVLTDSWKEVVEEYNGRK